MTDQPWASRIALARAAWVTEIRITEIGVLRADEGRRALGVWARTHYWKGWVADICLHDHAIVTLKGPDDVPRTVATLARLVDNVREACERAAVEYPDSVPCRLPDRMEDGRIALATNSFETGHIATRPPQHFPTEAIPAGMETTALGVEDGHLAALARATVDGLHVEDKLHPYFGRPRYASDCKDRSWGYETRLAARRAPDGTRIAFRPVRFSLETLDETYATSLVTSGAAATRARINRAVERTGALPPDLETLAEWAALEQARRAIRGGDPEQE